MLNPHIAPVVKEIINLFAKYELPISAKDEIFKTVEEIMNSRIVEPIKDIEDISNWDTQRKKFLYMED